MKILVSGAGGFIGRHVVAMAISQGLSVHTIAVQRPGRRDGLTDSASRHVVDSVDNAAAVREVLEKVAPEAILHLAGSTQAQAPTELYRVNTVYAQTILDAAVAVCPYARVLLAGSAAEYGPVPFLDRVHERVECRPNTLYGITKFAQTLQGMAVDSDKLNVVTARIFNCIGPGMPTSLAVGNFVRQVALMPPEGGQLVVGNLDAVRDFVAVDDVASALLQVATMASPPGEVLNIASGVGQSLAEFVISLRKAAHCPLELRRDDRIKGNSAMPRFVGDPTEIQKMGISIKPACFPELLPIMLKAAVR